MQMVRLLIALCAALLISWSTGRAQTPSGEAIYKQRCSACHDQAGSRIPPRQALQKMPALRILRAMNAGAMMTVAYPLRREEREAVATYLGTPGPEPGPQPEAFCKERAISLKPVPDYSWNGWSPRPDNARFQSADLARLSISQVRKLKLKWAFGLDGDISSYAQPTVVDGNVFMGSGAGMIYALRAATGCIEWTYQAGAPVREAVATGPIGDRRAVLFGDLTGMFYALDAQTGHLLWKKRIEDHEAALLTGSPTVYNGNVYVGVASWEETRAINPAYPCCSFRGSIVALDARNGAMLWKTFDMPDNDGQTDQYSGGAVWQPAAIDPKRGTLFIGTGNNYTVPLEVVACQNANPTADCTAPDDFFDTALALDLKTGRIKWSKKLQGFDTWTVACITSSGPNPNCPVPSSPDFDLGGSGPNLVGNIVGFGQKSGIFWALNPDNGGIVWSTPVGPGASLGGIEWGTATDGKRIYVAISNSDLLPYTLVPSGQQITWGAWSALDVATGEILWQTADPTPGTIDRGSVSVANGVMYVGSNSGQMYALNTTTGNILWSFASGGSVIDGPSIVDGTLYWGSGYKEIRGTGNNKVFAFSLARSEDGGGKDHHGGGHSDNHDQK